jgi:hypothetical protein
MGHTAPERIRYTEKKSIVIENRIQDLRVCSIPQPTLLPLAPTISVYKLCNGELKSLK